MNKEPFSRTREVWCRKDHSEYFRRVNRN